MQVFSYDKVENKLCKVSVFWMNDSRIHQNMKIARDDRDYCSYDFSMIIFALTPLWLVWILTVMPVWLYFSSFLFCSVLFLNTELYILYEC